MSTVCPHCNDPRCDRNEKVTPEQLAMIVKDDAAEQEIVKVIKEHYATQTDANASIMNGPEAMRATMTVARVLGDLLAVRGMPEPIKLLVFSLLFERASK